MPSILGCLFFGHLKERNVSEDRTTLLTAGINYGSCVSLASDQKPVCVEGFVNSSCSEELRDVSQDSVSISTSSSVISTSAAETKTMWI